MAQEEGRGAPALSSLLVSSRRIAIRAGPVGVFPISPSHPIPSRNVLLTLLVLLSVITFLDRLCIAVAGPRIQLELGISPQQWGWVLGAFILAYGIFEIPTGALGDRYGRGRVLTRIVLWWSGFTMLTGLATGFLPLVAIRFLFGTGEAGAYPNMAGVVSQSLPNQRAVAQGFIWGASRAGGALAPLLVVPIQAAFGWRASFFVFGAIGVIWCAVWRRSYRDESLQAGVAIHRDPTPWRLLFRSSQMRIIMLMYCFYAWGSWFYFSWLPTWLVKGRGFTEAEMGIFSALPFLMGAAGNLAGGFVSDAAVRRFGLRRGRVAPTATRPRHVPRHRRVSVGGHGHDSRSRSGRGPAQYRIRRPRSHAAFGMGHLPRHQRSARRRRVGRDEHGRTTRRIPVYRTLWIYCGPVQRL
jgi:MFS family permease